MKWIALLSILTLFGCSTLPPQTPKPIIMTSNVLNGTQKAFEKHKNYLAMDLPFAPMKRVFEQVESRAGLKLQNRGESHVTVLTPPEFDAIKSKVTIEDINRIAEKSRLQRAHLEALCVGRGEATLDGQPEQTFFIVLTAPELVSVRREIQQLFVKRGGNAQLFDAEKFYPHITVGFSKVDLHEQQGVIKDRRACAFDVEVLAD